jgi:hypothetical protein
MLTSDLYLSAGWIGLLLLSPIFLANAFGIVDQARAVAAGSGARP